MSHQTSGMDRDRVLESLNGALAMEYSSVIQYLTQGSLLEGLDSLKLREMLEEMAEEEIGHAKELLKRIWALGGTPDMKLGATQIARSVQEIVQLNYEAEKEAVTMYTKILNIVPRTEILLYETIEHILEDTVRSFEEWRRVRGRPD